MIKESRMKISTHCPSSLWRGHTLPCLHSLRLTKAATVVHASAWFSNQSTRDIFWHELILATLKKKLSWPSLLLFYLCYAVQMLPKLWASKTYAQVLPEQSCFPNSIHRGIHHSLLSYKAFHSGKHTIYGAKLHVWKCIRCTCKNLHIWMHEIS